MDTNPPKNNLKPDRYSIEAYNLVGSDPGLFRWRLGMEFIQLIQGAQHYGHTIDLQSLLAMDELLHVFSKEFFRGPSAGLSSPKRLITTGRFTGQGFVGGTQVLTALDASVPQNCATIVVLQCPDFDEAVSAARIISLPREKVPELQTLNKGEGFVFSAGWRQAVKIRIPFMDFGDYPSAATVKARLEPELEWIRQNTIYAEYDDSNSPPIEFLKIVGEKGAPKQSSTLQRPPTSQLLEDHFRFLKDAHDYPGDGVRARYLRLGVGIEKGNRLLAELKSVGAITVSQEKTARPTGGRSRFVATLTARGQELLQAYENSKSTS